MAGTILQVGIDLATGTIGKNHRSSFRALGLVRPKLDLPTRLAALGCDVADGECGDFSDTKSGIDGQDEGQAIAVGMSGGLNDPEDPSNCQLKQTLEP